MQIVFTYSLYFNVKRSHNRALYPYGKGPNFMTYFHPKSKPLRQFQ